MITFGVIKQLFEILKRITLTLSFYSKCDLLA